MPVQGLDGPVVARDMAGHGLQPRDWVFDGEAVWEIMGVTADGELVCRDPHAPEADAEHCRLAPESTAKVRADRADDRAYLRAVYEQARTLRAFWAEDD